MAVSARWVNFSLLFIMRLLRKRTLKGVPSHYPAGRPPMEAKSAARRKLSPHFFAFNNLVKKCLLIFAKDVLQ
jgi:hypothetical protein